MKPIAALCLPALLLLVSCGTAPVENDGAAFTRDTAEIDELDLVAKWLCGSFSSEAQADADTNFFDIRLETVPIWCGRTDGRWIYVEQAAAWSLEKPYRQRVYHVTPEADGSWRSAVFSMESPLRFAGAWREADPLAALTPDSLTAREGCAVILRRQPNGSFSGSTVDAECVSTLRGASYATSEVTLWPDRIESWDRGWNEADEQVWGAETGGYVFLRTKSSK